MPRPVRWPVRWPVLLALALLAPARGLARPAAADGPPPTCADCTEARVLASPGWPAALRTFLPPGRPVEPLALPLPPGPLLLLGLTGSDPVARALAEALLDLDPEGDLGGGYVAAAWTDGGRPVAAIFAEDAAALAAARDELETFTPERRAEAPRSLEFTKPDEQAGVRVALGRREVRPRWRWRGLAGLAPGESALDLAGAHANRLCLPPDAPAPGTEALAAHGVLRTTSEAGSRLAGPGAGAGPTSPPERLLVPDPRLLEQGAVPFLGDAPGALLGVTLTPTLRARLSRAWVADLRRRAAAPLVLVDPWMEPTGGPVPRLPSLPRGIPREIDDLIEGVLLRPGPGATTALAAAWAPTSDAEAFPEHAELLAAAPPTAAEPARLLTETAAGLRAALDGRSAVAPWLAALPAHLEAAAAALPPVDAQVSARLVPEPVVPDGRLDERAWAFAAPRRLGDADLLALSDGRRLALGLRLPDASEVRGVALVLTGDGGRRVELEALAPSSPTAPAAPAVTRHLGRRGAAREVEILVDREALGGDPYLTRVFGLEVTVAYAGGQWRLHPGPGALVVVR